MRSNSPPCFVQLLCCSSERLRFFDGSSEKTRQVALDPPDHGLEPRAGLPYPANPFFRSRIHPDDQAYAEQNQDRPERDRQRKDDKTDADQADGQQVGRQIDDQNTRDSRLAWDQTMFSLRSDEVGRSSWRRHLSPTLYNLPYPTNPIRIRAIGAPGRSPSRTPKASKNAGFRLIQVLYVASVR